jgi:glutaconate CoA-transferase subunit B
MTQATDCTLAELMIVACSEAWRNDGEVLASGITTVPRLGASLAKLTHSPELLMTDSETFLVSEPVPLGARGDYVPKYEGYMSFDRVFECVWGGKRHAMIGPTQIDRFGQANLSCVGPDYAKPKSAVLGVRGLPGNNINHANSYFVPNHGPRVFVANEVDMVSGPGYNPARFEPGMKNFVDLRVIVTDLCVMDFKGPDHAIRVKSLHPGVTFEQVQAATGFPVIKADDIGETPMPTAEQLEIIRRLDPHNLRGMVIKNNPPAIRDAAPAA